MSDKKPAAKAPAKPSKPSDSERIDAILAVLRENGLSLDHHKALK